MKYLPFILILWALQLQAQKSIKVTPDNTTVLLFKEGINEVIKGKNLAFEIEKKTSDTQLSDKILRLNTAPIFDGKLQKTNLIVITKTNTVHEFDLQQAKYTDKHFYIIEKGGLEIDKKPIKAKKITNKSIDSETKKITVEVPQKVAVPSSYYSDSVKQETGLESKEIQLVRLYSKKYVKSKDRAIRTVKKSGNVRFILNNITHFKDQVFYHLEIENKGVTAFDVDFINYLIADKYKGTSTDSDTALKPKSSFEVPEKIEGKNSAYFVVGFEKFTIGENRVFQIVLSENEGARDLVLDIKAEWVNDPINLMN